MRAVSLCFETDGQELRPRRPSTHIRNSERLYIIGIHRLVQERPHEIVESFIWVKGFSCLAPKSYQKWGIAGDLIPCSIAGQSFASTDIP
jgi:hypothetical protein